MPSSPQLYKYGKVLESSEREGMAPESRSIQIDEVDKNKQFKWMSQQQH